MPLYKYQQRVKSFIQAGRNVILQAPTGAGKTRAALAPFIEAFFDFPPDRFPHKCVYAVPMRVLANQFFREYRGLAESYERKYRRSLKVEIQTGERRADPRFEADLTFATIDQVLSSFLFAPYSLPRRLSNLNAGAIASSYLVFDEFHLFDSVSTLPTTLEMLKLLKGVVPFMLMTATFSTDMLEGLAKALDAVVMPEDEPARIALQALPSQNKTRRYHVVEDVLTAEAILEKHRRRTLVVCNTVDRARKLFESLRGHPQLGSTKVLLLHSRFLLEDRKRLEDSITELFKEGNEFGSWIVVATQTIEVGLNITCENLHTELAPANAILQRAGRCARYSGQEGDVYIYARAQGDGELVDLTENTMPYAKQRAVIQRSWMAFSAYAGQTLTFDVEQAIISQAHGPNDRLILKGLEATQTQHFDRMARVMSGDRHADAGDLIRVVSSQLVVVHDDPQAVAERPFVAEAFNLHPGVVRKYVYQWQRDHVLAGNNVQVLLDVGDKDESGRSIYTWKPVMKAKDLQGAVLVLVHPELAGYDVDLGFMLGQNDMAYRAKLEEVTTERKVQYGNYTLETYHDHVERVYGAFKRVWASLAESAVRMERVFAWPEGILKRAACLVVLFHDVGKLNQVWQRWVREYQATIGQPISAGEVYAHTDFDLTNPQHKYQQYTLGRRPSHAVEGATAVAPLLALAFEPYPQIVKAAFTAIARHHGAFTKQGQAYALVPQSRAVIQETLHCLPDAGGWEFNMQDLWVKQSPTEERVRGLLVTPQYRKELLPYMLLARVLRLADQEGTRLGIR